MCAIPVDRGRSRGPFRAPTGAVARGVIGGGTWHVGAIGGTWHVQVMGPFTDSEARIERGLFCCSFC